MASLDVLTGSAAGAGGAPLLDPGPEVVVILIQASTREVVVVVVFEPRLLAAAQERRPQADRKLREAGVHLDVQLISFNVQTVEPGSREKHAPAPRVDPDVVPEAGRGGDLDGNTSGHDVEHCPPAVGIARQDDGIEVHRRELVDPENAAIGERYFDPRSAGRIESVAHQDRHVHLCIEGLVAARRMHRGVSLQVRDVAQGGQVVTAIGQRARAQQGSDQHPG
ncbi:MAG: hypothetical protein KA072_12515 [Thermoanaerobaculaceae bacterium]|nr:hypothetical protein [Thermoanaerobaculaceae bacterium]MDI9620275.1 hypothetical protein [Acidobacteriota bacterium]NLH11219.1 hypothetical protein [Holophagae bacterium]HPW56472.1 hypothetical protein [Thermoanaerobaculaceae bacterium]